MNNNRRLLHGYAFLLFISVFLLTNKYGIVYNCIVYGTEQLEQNLCKSKVCPNYGKCKIDEVNFFAKCVCPSECDLNDLNSSPQMFMIKDEDDKPRQKTKEIITNELFSQTVCGNDGRDYTNFCELKKESCESNKEIKIFYFGKCSMNKFYFKITSKLVC